MFTRRAGDDKDLQVRVREPLAAHEAADDFLTSEPPPSAEVEAELARLKPEEAGEMIGPYKLREQIGEGGFGTVWVADQEKPVRWRVAPVHCPFSSEAQTTSPSFRAKTWRLAKAGGA